MTYVGNTSYTNDYTCAQSSTTYRVHIFKTKFTSATKHGFICCCTSGRVVQVNTQFKAGSIGTTIERVSTEPD